MILTCPACATRYIVKPTAIGRDGRTVRCAKCGHTWHETAPPAPSPPPRSIFDDPLDDEPTTPPSMIGGGTESASFEPQPDFMRQNRRAYLPAIPEPRPRLTGVMLGWIGLVGTLVTLAVCLAVFEVQIIQLWPPAARLYMLAGIAPPTDNDGLEIRGLNSARADVNGTPGLIVAGEVANVGKSPRTLPILRMNLRNQKNEVLVTKDFTIDRPKLLPGETVPFTTSVPAPPGDATSIAVQFVPK